MASKKSKEAADLIFFMTSFIFEVIYLIFAYFKGISQD